MRTCTEKQDRPAVPVSSREAAERAAALTKEQGVIWESDRSFSITANRDGNGAATGSVNGDQDTSED